MLPRTFGFMGDFGSSVSLIERGPLKLGGS